MGSTPFQRHLLAVFWGLFLFQNGLFFLLNYLYVVPLTQGTALWFYPVNLVYHLVIYKVLGMQKKYYVNSLTGLPLESVSWPNFLTLARASSVPSLAVLFLLTRDFSQLSLALVVFVTLAFLTDLLDGWLSRKLGQISDLGKILDSSTDYMVLFALSIVLGLAGLLPLWMLVLIMFRLAWQAILMTILSFRFKGPVLETTFLGKASFFAIMVLYALEILVYFRIPFLEGGRIETWCQYLTAVLVVLSLGDKFLHFLKKWREPVSEA